MLLFILLTHRFLLFYEAKKKINNNNSNSSGNSSSSSHNSSRNPSGDDNEKLPRKEVKKPEKVSSELEDGECSDSADEETKSSNKKNIIKGKVRASTKQPVFVEKSDW